MKKPSAILPRVFYVKSIFVKIMRLLMAKNLRHNSLKYVFSAYYYENRN